MGQRSEKRAAAQEKIIAKAIEQIRSGGVASLRCRALGEGAGFSRALPNYYFGSLDAIKRVAVARITGQQFPENATDFEMQRAVFEADRKSA